MGTSAELVPRRSTSVKQVPWPCSRPCICPWHLPAQELWQLLISANETGTGIPQRFLDEKAEEMRRQKEEAERVQVGRRWGLGSVRGAGWSA